MSLIQSALEKANRPAGKTPTPVILPKPSIAATSSVKPQAVRTPVLPKEPAKPVLQKKQEEKQEWKPLPEKQNRTQLKYPGLIFSGIVFLVGFGVFIALAWIFAKPPAMTTAGALSTTIQKTSAAPTTPVFAKTKSKNRFQLSGITFSGSDRLALVNNQVLGVGDKLPEGAVVKSISTDAVLLEFQGKNIELTLR